MTETIAIDIDPRGVARLVLARPEKHNALSARMIDELAQAAAWLGSNGTVRAVVLAAEGPSFCAGGDLDWMRAQFAATRDERLTEARRLAAMLKAWNMLPKPLVGCIQGNAFGGGVGLMSICDTVIAASTVRVGLSEVRLGLIPATIGPYVVARIGEGRARSLCLSGRIIDAREAREIGLVSSVVPAADLDNAVEAELGHYLSTSPQASAQAKVFLRELGMPITDAIIEDAAQRLADAWESVDAREGIAAFFARRPPIWVRKD